MVSFGGTGGGGALDLVAAPDSTMFWGRLLSLRGTGETLIRRRWPLRLLLDRLPWRNRSEGIVFNPLNNRKH